MLANLVEMTHLDPQSLDTATETISQADPKRSDPPSFSEVTTVFVLIVACLYFGKEVLLPITLALLLAFILAPLVALLRKLSVPRVPAVLLGMSFALGVILAIGAVIGSQISELSTHIPEYATTIEDKVSSARSYTVTQLTDLADHIGVQPSMLGFKAGAPGKAAAPQNAPAPTVAPLDFAQKYLSPVLSPLGTLFIVIIIAIFALLQQDDLRDRMIRLLGSNDLHRTTLAIDDGGRRLSRYFMTQLSINALFGVVIGVGLLLIGVPNPILFAIISGLLRFVPYIGSIISAILPLCLAAAVDPGWTLTIYTAVLYISVEGITGQFIEPITYGHSTGLSPFSVVVAALFWSWVWGPIGLILSTPLTLCLVVVGRHSKRLEFLDILLGDRPALTPVESLYQRIFAGDADEAQDQAEQLLKEVSLSDYFDSVLVKALQLAVRDVERGALKEDQIRRLRRSVKSMVHGLKDHEDKQPDPTKPGPTTSPVKQPDDAFRIVATERAPTVPENAGIGSWSDADRVMCIAGRGPFDDIASRILAQLLEKHGMNARLTGYDAVSRERFADLDTANVRMVCISYLDLNGSPAHLRYLIRRLRQRLPNSVPIHVGVWSTDDPILKDAKLAASVGADYIGTSFRDIVVKCSEVALRPEATTSDREVRR